MNSFQSHRAAMQGFTLVELVVSIVLTAIVVGFATMFLTTPVDAYISQTRRAGLTESSAAMTRRMSADLQRALPNSVRVGVSGTRSSVEMLLVEEVAFFRTGGTADANLLLAPGTDSYFSSIGKFRRASARPLDLAGMRLAVGNSGTGLTNAYSGAGAMTSTASTIRLLDDAGGAADEDKIQVIGTAAKFTALPASNRMFLVSGAVTYICNSTAQTLRRFAKYTIGAAVPVSETDGRFTPAAVENTVVGNNVVACRITCSSTAAPGCRDTLIVDMAVSRPTLSPDLMRVLLEEPVDNTP